MSADYCKNVVIGSTKAGEVMTVVQMAIQANAPYTLLRDAVLSHPTMSEGLNVLFSTLG